MVGSTVGFIIGFNSDGIAGNSIRVNGVKLNVVPGGYEATIKGATIAFTYSPSAANRTIIPAQAFDRLISGGFVYLTSDPNSSSAQDIALTQFQIAEMLRNEFNVQSQVAFDKPLQNFPVVTCENASQYVPVIVFKDSNETNASYQNGCLVLTAQNSAAYIELRDRVAYGIFGILR